MIVVCDPVIKGISHEKINSGFIYGLRLAYPDEKILFYADEFHITEIKNIFISYNVVIDNIDYFPIRIYNQYSVSGMIGYSRLFIKIFNNMLSDNVDKIFFLCFDSVLFYIIKQLKRLGKYKNIKCTSVLHGSFEQIRFTQYTEIPILQPAPAKSINQNVSQKIRSVNYMELPSKILKVLKSRINKWINVFIITKYQLMFLKIFHVPKILMYRHSNHFKYIALSPHILNNARNYLNIEFLNIYAITMPMIFIRQNVNIHNQYIKFAIFGYGDSYSLSQISGKLSEKKIGNQYEIRIIGMDARGTNDNPNIWCVSPGRVLNRSEMEKFVDDIDIFLILYKKDRYQLGCSASILEAISYIKPILHFDNDCINYFNKPDSPIGFQCESLEAYVDKMVELINNYPEYLTCLELFRKNIITLRNKVAINNNLDQLRESFSFVD